MNNVPLLKDDEIAEDVRNTVEFVKGLAAQGEDAFTPMLRVTALDTNGNLNELIIAITEMPEESSERHELMASLGAKCVQDGFMPIAATFYSEAWLASVEEGEVSNCRPSEHPERVEILMITCMTLNQKVCYSHLEMRRREGQTMLLVPYEGKEEISPVFSLNDTGEGKTIITPIILMEFFKGVGTAFLLTMIRPQ